MDAERREQLTARFFQALRDQLEMDPGGYDSGVYIVTAEELTFTFHAVLDQVAGECDRQREENAALRSSQSALESEVARLNDVADELQEQVWG